MEKLIGKFKQMLSLRHLASKGVLADEDLEIIEDAGIWVKNGKIVEIGAFETLAPKAHKSHIPIEEIVSGNWVLMPSFIDCHTHICFGGNRAKDYALRIAGKTYLDIAKAGGGILDTVRKTREATFEQLYQNTQNILDKMLKNGVSTIEVKSGYGLSVAEEIKILEVIKQISSESPMTIIPTCLAAHTLPPEFSEKEFYLAHLTEELLPVLSEKKLSKRVDIFVEPSAFPMDIARKYLENAKNQGFEICIHADQFSVGGSRLAVELQALSADHLEASTAEEINLLANSSTVAVVLPGASLGLGMPFAPARQLLDAGACVAISTDYNPGSAPMGNLLLQASVLAAQEKLTTAETLAAITFRAAQALALPDRGRLETGFWADMIAFACEDYREILYWQGQMLPSILWKEGRRLF
ncbi:MAG: imidazolonepropionase [Thermonemataceae bacterium]|nr:imidazolonepropionase [Thermonemataceae bacterium]